MPTSYQNFNAARGSMYLATQGDANDQVTAWYELNGTQEARMREAVGLWDDVSNFSGGISADDAGLAGRSVTWVTETFLGIPTGGHWQNNLSFDWTRVAVADIAGTSTLGVNKTFGANNRYHEVYIDSTQEGVGDFQLGSIAFNTLVHELGHSVIDGTDSDKSHIPGDPMHSIMDASSNGNVGGLQGPNAWYAATPMTYDIDQAIRQHGASTTTRTGDDVYGFNARFSGPYRAAFDFSVNTRPLVTIYDNGGNDTLDASGFRDGSGNARAVHVDLRQGEQSRMLDGDRQIFALIYTTSWVENAVGGGANDELVGNGLSNRLTGNGGNDTLWGQGGNDTLDGGAGDNLLFGEEGADLLLAGGGNDTLWGGIGADRLDAGAGANQLFGETGSDTLVSGAGADHLDGGEGFDYADYGGSATGVAADLSTGKVLYGNAQGDTLVGIEGLLGSGHDDTLTGGTGASYLGGQGGNDDLRGLSANDTLSGGSGHDTLTGGGGADWLDGGEGVDTASFGGAAVSINLTSGVHGGEAAGDVFVSIERFAGTGNGDTMVGNASGNTFLGRGGDDRLYGYEGSDTLDGGAGADTLDGGGGSDWASYASSGQGVYADLSLGKVLYGDAQGDTLVSIENLEGSGYNDTLAGGEDANTLWGQGGNDELRGNGGNDTLAGQAGSDTLTGGLGADYLDGGDGADWASYTDSSAGVTIDLSSGKVAGTGGTAQGDTLVSIENIYGSTLADRITGSADANTFLGGLGNDTLLGLAGADTLNGGTGEDSIDGGTGADLVDVVASGGDRVAGGDEFDRLIVRRADGQGAWSFDAATGRGSDGFTASGFERFDVYGGNGAETLLGSAAADLIGSGAGADVLTGRGGRDVFVFDAALLVGNADHITDFTATGAESDTIQLARGVFTTLGAGALAEDAFKDLGTGAADASDRILYDRSTGGLFYDADGSGAGAQVQFATLDNLPTLSAANFAIV